MTHTVDKSCAVACFLAEDLPQEICYLALIVPVLYVVLYVLVHLNYLVVSAAVTGALQ